MIVHARWVLMVALWLWAGGALAGTKYYYYTDPQGTVLAEADAQGNIIASYDYAPYGTQVLGTPPSGPAGYTGHVNDAESGLVYMQQRYYDPAVGRFLSVDPLKPSPGNVFSFNRYAYANNNPVRYTDPDGRRCGTVDGKDSCTFDGFKDKKGKTVSREQAMSSGSKWARFFHKDSGSRILRAEAAMTAKYSAAKDLAAKGGEVTIKGNGKLGIPDQKISGSSIVNHMEATQTIADAQDGPRSLMAYTPIDPGATTGHGPITFYKNGAKSPNFGQTFGHEIFHTIYSGAGLTNRGWANPNLNYDHQTPFNDASDAIY